eukprot:g13.t1
MSEDIVSFDPLPSAKLEVDDGPVDAWEVFTTDEGELYYHNEATGETTWENPSELAAATELQEEQAANVVEQSKDFAVVGGNADHGANEEGNATGSNQQSAEESKEISLAAFLLSLLLAPNTAVACSTHEKDGANGSRGVVSNYAAGDDLLCYINFGDGRGARPVKLTELECKISIPEGTPIHCDKLVGHEVEVLKGEVYYSALVKQANADNGANFLRFVNGDKEWMDLTTKTYNLVSSPEIDYDASLVRPGGMNGGIGGGMSIQVQYDSQLNAELQAWGQPLCEGVPDEEAQAAGDAQLEQLEREERERQEQEQQRVLQRQQQQQQQQQQQLERERLEQEPSEEQSEKEKEKEKEKAKEKAKEKEEEEEEEEEEHREPEEELDDAEADDWQKYTTDEGEVYYHNETTGETTWEQPDEYGTAAEEELQRQEEEEAEAELAQAQLAQAQSQSQLQAQAQAQAQALAMAQQKQDEEGKSSRSKRIRTSGAADSKHTTDGDGYEYSSGGSDDRGWSPWALWVGVGRQAQARQQKEQELQQM